MQMRTMQLLRHYDLVRSLGQRSTAWSSCNDLLDYFEWILTKRLHTLISFNSITLSSLLIELN
jgi:hypothetical protein